MFFPNCIKRKRICFSVINANNEMYKKMCEKHTTDAINSFQETIVNMANRLGPEDSRKLLEYLNILEKSATAKEKTPEDKIKNPIVQESKEK